MAKKTTTKKEIKEIKPLQGKVLDGIVTSTKMKDTVVVTVGRYVRVPKYRKYVTITKKYKAHDAGNTCKEGDKVSIRECRPISKDKHFIVIK